MFRDAVFQDVGFQNTSFQTLTRNSFRREVHTPPVVEGQHKTIIVKPHIPELPSQGRFRNRVAQGPLTLGTGFMGTVPSLMGT